MERFNHTQKAKTPEKVSRLRKHWDDYLRDCVILFCVFFVSITLARVPAAYIDPGTVIPVVLAPLFVSILLKKKHNFPISETLQSLGVPMGLLFSAIALVSIFDYQIERGEMIDVGAVGPIVSIMLLCVFYGVLMHAIGYLVSDKAHFSEASLPISSKSYFVCLGCCLWCFLAATASTVSQIEAWWLFSLQPILLCLSISALFVFSKRQTGLAENLADASLMIVVVGVMLSLIELYGNINPVNAPFIQPQLFFEISNYAHYCLMYGAAVYISSFLMSLRTNEFQDINFKARNWHMLEAFSFYVFMTLAAPGIFELV